MKFLNREIFTRLNDTDFKNCVSEKLDIENEEDPRLMKSLDPDTVGFALGRPRRPGIA